MGKNRLLGLFIFSTGLDFFAYDRVMVIGRIIISLVVAKTIANVILVIRSISLCTLFSANLLN